MLGRIWNETEYQTEKERKIRMYMVTRITKLELQKRKIAKLQTFLIVRIDQKPRVYRLRGKNSLSGLSGQCGHKLFIMNARHKPWIIRCEQGQASRPPRGCVSSFDARALRVFRGPEVGSGIGRRRRSRHVLAGGALDGCLCRNVRGRQTRRRISSRIQGQNHFQRARYGRGSVSLSF